MDQLKKQKELEEYKNSLEGKNLEELKALEQEVIKEADEINDKIAKYEFPLASKGYKEAAQAIRYFLNKKDVTWQYTVGMLTMYDFWNPDKNPKKVFYPMFDGTLRTIGDMKFTGADEWRSVITINDYFKDIRDEYASLTEEIYDNAARHNMIYEKMQVLDPSLANNANVQ